MTPVRRPQKVVGVTGLIGSGKSMVSHFLSTRLACTLLDADDLARQVMAVGQPGWQAIKDYNPVYINVNGELDRVQLRHDIFSNPAVKEEVDRLIHPLVRRELAILLKKKRGTVVVEVPLLFEAGWDKLCDATIFVYATKEVCIGRVVSRDGVDAQQVEKTLQCQMAAAEKIKRAHHIINNSGAWWDTQLQLLHLIDILFD